MAEGDQDQKTEEPTQKKLDDARAKGEVASTPEMRHATMFAAAAIVVGGLGASGLASLGEMFVRLWGNADDYALAPRDAQNLVGGVLLKTASSMAPVAAVLLGGTLLALFLQGRPTLAWARLRLRWSSLSPAKGMARLFGPRALVEFGKTLVKFVAISLVAVYVAWPSASSLDSLVGASPGAVASHVAALGLAMIKAVALLVAMLAAADFFHQRRAFLRRMRMSLQEIRDEHKQSEGDPKIKARIAAIRVRRARQRMMAAVPGASVVITNPTHYAVALKYEHGTMAAPVVVAKGVEELALKIREFAARSGVPVVESPPLARALFASVGIDEPIPVEHYAAVAEIIGYVMRLARRVR